MRRAAFACSKSSCSWFGIGFKLLSPSKSSVEPKIGGSWRFKFMISCYFLHISSWFLTLVLVKSVRFILIVFGFSIVFCRRQNDNYIFSPLAKSLIAVVLCGSVVIWLLFQLAWLPDNCALARAAVEATLARSNVLMEVAAKAVKR